ncbi:MAG: nitric oxide reductase activation protein NorD [Gammaproteobacteria bacterium]|nr:MAG: nitric oxide reductase activation protein NorD [Gammaproteobacteria bacterium]
MAEIEELERQLAGSDPHIRDCLGECLREASRAMSPAGLRAYLEGAAALQRLGRGPEPVISYLQAMPLVAKEVGEEAVQESVTAALRLASMASGEVVALLFASLPTAARRLGDLELLRGYLHLVHQLSAKAPRGLRPMLGRLDELLGKLTLGGLRRWALWGAQAHARDLEAQARYFALETEDSRAVLQRERRGTLFVDTHRRLRLYLRALWGRDFLLRPTSGDHETRAGLRPSIERGVIHLPDAYDDYHDLDGLALYRAAASHAAAHLAGTPEPLDPEGLTPAQMLLTGLFEDARVEQRAVERFPGLREVWLAVHRAAEAEETGLDPAVARLRQAARAMLEPGFAPQDPWAREAAAAFQEAYAREGERPRMSRELGVAFHRRLAAAGPLPPLRVLEQALLPYRDDNRWGWAFGEEGWGGAEQAVLERAPERRVVSVMEMVNEVDVETASDRADVWVLQSELFPYEDEGVSYNQREGLEPASEPFHYPEWDYRLQLYRPDWVTVLEKRQGVGEAEAVDRVLDRHRLLAARIRRLIDALQPQGVLRLRRQEDGDDIDLDAAVAAMVDLRAGHTPDLRVDLRYRRRVRDLAVLVLLDLSESTNDTLPGSERPVIELAREATALLAWAIDRIGDPFAIHGFASDGRHDVQYFRFKDFHRPYDEQAKARLAGMRGGLSTRMGAALRHAGRHLRARPEQKRLLLLISDGEPADIDVRDPQYLRHDTKKAVEELARAQVQTFCLTLDPEADRYVGRIFGANRYSIVDRVERLPERLPTLFALLTRAP